MSPINVIINISLMLFSITAFAFGAKSVKEPSYLPCSEEVFWWATMMSESSGKPDTCYKESDGTLSCGLYQLSMTDAKAYGCKFVVQKDLYNPALNTDCKDRIAAKLRLDGKTWDNSLARYWGTMRSKQNPTWTEWHKRNPNHKGYEHLQQWAKTKGCLIQ